VFLVKFAEDEELVRATNTLEERILEGQNCDFRSGGRIHSGLRG